MNSDLIRCELDPTHFVKKTRLHIHMLKCRRALSKDCRALRDLKIKVPTAVKRGDQAILQCNYNIEGDPLYSVKWYRGEMEFYRYLPGEKPHIKQFKIRGLIVNEQLSSDKQVVLEDVPRDISGTFRCEVSADQPSFFTAIQAATLMVVDVPRTDPHLKGLQTRYKLNEMLKADCISEDSYPPANLTWLVNGHPVAPVHIFKKKPIQSSEGLYTARSELRVKLSKQHFATGRLKIRCVASIFDIYYRSSEKSVELEKKRHRQVIMIQPTTDLPMSLGQWEVFQPAERHPETTLVFSPINSLASTHNFGIMVNNSSLLLFILTSMVLLR